MSNASPVIRVLFVCTGNICRSPTAEGVFRHKVEKEGLAESFVIDSAGTDGYHEGEPPDRRAVKAAKKRGVLIGHQRARALTHTDYNIFDYIYAMDGGHLHVLEERAPASRRAKLAMFLSETPALGLDVPDPWYGGEKDFEDVYALVDAGAAALLKKIREEHRI